MSMNSLKALPRQQRSSVLSSLGSFLLPTPFEDIPSPSEIQKSVLEEIGQRFGYKGIAVPKNLLPAVQKLVLKELSALMMESKPQEIRARVGQKGLLPNNHYSVSFSEHFMHTCSNMGVSKRLAASTVSTPAFFEHVLPEDFGIYGMPSHSLFVQAHPHLVGCSVLVLAVRRNSTLDVEGGWLVFHDLVGSTPSDKPLVMLERFANHYGTEIKVGHLKGNFFLLTEVKIDSNGSTEIFSIENKNFGAIDIRCTFAHSYGIVRIALAFNVVVTRYADDLLLRNVPISREFQRSSLPNPVH